jgi:hypothetical protein
LKCRIGCAACCVNISISSPIPGMPEGKLAGVRCIQLTGDGLCKVFGLPSRPDICNRLAPDEEMCGTTDQHAYAYLAALETATRP